MKFIVALSLIIVSLSAISAQAVDPFKQAWCGNSKVNVEISTLNGNQQVITKASIIVPVYLAKLDTYDNSVKKIVDKDQQGLILSLEDKANKDHLGVIYNYDEDDKSQIFIPYLYISSVKENNGKFEFTMERTFKGPQDLSFTMSPIPDEYKTNLCECQLQMFNARITENILKRIQVLTYIAVQIQKSINEISNIDRILKEWRAKKVDTSKLQQLEKDFTAKTAECDALQKKIQSLNSDLNDENKKNQDLKNKLSRTNKNIKKWTRILSSQQNKLNQDAYTSNGELWQSVITEFQVNDKYAFEIIQSFSSSAQEIESKYYKENLENENTVKVLRMEKKRNLDTLGSVITFLKGYNTYLTGLNPGRQH